MSIVVVSGVSKEFGSVIALQDISFDIGSGEVVGLLGPNGAGKTTMVDILSTLTRPDQGHAYVAGHDVVANPVEVRRSIMLTGQQVAVDNLLTGRQNLVMFGRLRGLGKSAARERATELIGELDLTDAADRRVDTYSGGMRRRIDIACGLVVIPRVAFLDEPTTGLDPRSRHRVWDIVRRLKTVGVATLLTTQYLEEADALCGRIIVINRGAIVAEGSPSDLKELAGGTVCEITPENPYESPAVREVLSPLLPKHGRTVATTASDRVVLPAPDGAHTLVAALRRLDAANIAVADVALRRPSLDEVFFALTAEQSAEDVVP
jgi:ABC-2 type transport system ATP-binding protein